MIDEHSNLTLCVLDEESHKRTCNYWYLVRTGWTMSHTAFRTKHALLRWLDERGLVAPEPITEPGVHSYQKLVGSYRTEMHYTADEVERFHALVAAVESRTLSNGSWTLARITHDADGIRTVHTLNPNVARVTFDYWESNRLMDGEQA